MRRITLLFVGIALVATAAVSGEGTVRRNARHIPGRYIVVLEPGADTAAVANTVRSINGAQVRNTYQRGVKGLAVDMSDADALSLARDARVQFVEEDATVSATATTWGLDRINQHALPLDNDVTGAGTGAGVNVYIVDTGILATHDELVGRVGAGFSAFNDGSSVDCNGHGTHVAGVAGGTTYGVAKSATLVPVRVLDCNGSGSIATVLAGLDWVLQDHAQSPRPSVVNMSLGGNPSSALDSEVNNLLAAGMTVVVAAGNNNSDACSTSPARVAGALTVGASNEADARAPFSNYGTCVDLFAPGTNILSSWYTSSNATASSSGTSEAAPFVAGVAALTLEKYPQASPRDVSQTLVSQATLDTLSSVGTGSPNRLLYSLIGALEAGSADAQLLGDPSFDYGETFWTSDICTVVNQSGCPPGDAFDMWSFPSRSGNGHAALGGSPKTFHLSSETVTIPSTVRRAELTFYLWVVTKDPKLTANDVLTVEIRSASGALLATVGKFSNLDANTTYEQKRIDVTRYRGSSIRISFTGVQSQGPPTWFLIDDVGLNIWR